MDVSEANSQTESANTDHIKSYLKHLAKCSEDAGTSGKLATTAAATPTRHNHKCQQPRFDAEIIKN